MIRQDICEALYALPNGVVQPRRRSVVKPLCIALAGMAVMVANVIFTGFSNDALSMLLVVVGVSLILYGIIATMMRMVGDERVPYHTPTQCYMNYRERYFSHEKLAELKAALSVHDIERIDSIETSSISAITLAECTTKDGILMAYALYEYDNYEDRLVDKVKIVRK